MQEVPKKSVRLRVILDHLQTKPPASSWNEAYDHIGESIKHVEDMFWGPETYAPPTSLLDVTDIPRMYPPHPESIFTVSLYTHVRILISSHHVTFISTSGAIEIQHKQNDDKYGDRIHFSRRADQIIFVKSDAWGDGVWHSKNL